MMTARKPGATPMPNVTPPLLTKNDPPPFTVINGGGSARCLLISDHAGNEVPEKLNNLGLSSEDLQKHIAWDIGVRYITRKLSEILDAPAILGNVSRLVVDLNRRLDHPTAFVMHGEGQPIPGNLAMTEYEKSLRVAEIYEPFHREAEKLVNNFKKRNVVPAVVSLHSFTPVFFRQKRPWEIGFLWVQDSRLPLPLIEFFRGKGYCVGDNEPYDGRILRGTTINRHADDHGFPNVLVEFRNDEVDTDEKCDKWAELMAESLELAFRDESLFTAYDGPLVRHDPEMEMKYFDELIEKAKSGE